MKKYFSLIKACMSEGMNILRIRSKSKNSITKVLVPVLLVLLVMSVTYSYSETMILNLKEVNMEYVLLALFVIITSFITLIEGIYKSGNLLFNCKDDNLLFSLPIRKRTVLLVRILKFYLFELAYNSLFLIPVLFTYAIHIKPSITYYLVSIIALLIFPIIPILISSIIGIFITFMSSKFKGKTYIQTLLTVISLVFIMYISFNLEKLMNNISYNASSINDIITKMYYPAGAYIELVLNFKVTKLLEFILINLGAFIITIGYLGKFYFKINSKNSIKKVTKSNNNYVIKTLSPVKSLIKKEFSRFINSTVFITNAGFGLVLFIIGCIIFSIKYENIINMLIGNGEFFKPEYIESIIPLVLFTFISFSSFMTSITSSMISLEGKSINILKSLPIKTYKIVQSKVLTAVLIMLPCILIGDIICFIRFKFDIIDIVLILIASVLFPVLSETIGIIVNLKYPKLDAQNDTEVVKQSMSSMISVFLGMGLTGITVFLLFKALENNISSIIIMLGFIILYSIIYLCLLVLLHKTCKNSFDRMTV